MPNVPEDIGTVLRTMQAQIRELQGRVNTRPALNHISGGGVTIDQGGTLSVITPGGQTVLYVGAIGPAHPDGSPQYGTVLRREDGSAALAVWDGAGASPQPLAIWDRGGSTIFADDRVAGQGLARPYLSTDAWFGATEVPAFTTNSATFVTLQNLPWVKQHPRVTAHYLVKADAGVAGEIQLVDDNNVVIAGPITVAAGAWTYSSATGPLAGALYSSTYLHWQARVTSGTGVIGVRGLSTFGVQS